MKWNLLITFALLVGCIGSGGQTNSPPAPRLLFSLSALPLRELPRDVESGRALHAPDTSLDEHGRDLNTSSPNSAFSGTNAIPPTNLTNQISFTSGELTPVGAALYERLVQQGYFTRRESEIVSPFEHFVETVFVPEVAHLGKVDLSCSILTAIQRKNPLCLLNPIFFQLSW
jgi:hypothetical protein